MTIYYDQNTQNYIAFDPVGNWYPQSPTMLGAIQNAISIKFYWHSLKSN